MVNKTGVAFPGENCPLRLCSDLEGRTLVGAGGRIDVDRACLIFLKSVGFRQRKLGECAIYQLSQQLRINQTVEFVSGRGQDMQQSTLALIRAVLHEIAPHALH